MDIDPAKKESLNQYLDEIMPPNPGEPHPYYRFHLNEIVRHPIFGNGIITGFRMLDSKREFEGLGIQFVSEGKMGEHAVFTPAECYDIETTGFVFDGKKHKGLTLEQVIKSERGDAPLPGLR